MATSVFFGLPDQDPLHVSVTLTPHESLPTIKVMDGENTVVQIAFDRKSYNGADVLLVAAIVAGMAKESFTLLLPQAYEKRRLLGLPMNSAAWPVFSSSSFSFDIADGDPAEVAFIIDQVPSQQTMEGMTINFTITRLNEVRDQVIDIADIKTLSFPTKVDAATSISVISIVSNGTPLGSLIFVHRHHKETDGLTIHTLVGGKRKSVLLLLLPQYCEAAESLTSKGIVVMPAQIGTLYMPSVEDDDQISFGFVVAMAPKSDQTLEGMVVQTTIARLKEA